MLKVRITFMAVGILVAIYALGCEATQKSSHHTEATKRGLLIAETLSDIGLLTLCLVRLSCEPEIIKSIYIATDRCVQRTREAPYEGISNEEYMLGRYKSYLLTIEEMKSISSRCKKTPFSCNNQCRGKPLDAPQEVIDMGKTLTVVAQLVKCILAKNEPALLNTMETIFVDAIKRVAVSDSNAATSVGIAKKQMEDVVISLRKLDEKCARFKAVNGKCSCEYSCGGNGCNCGCGSNH